MATVRPCDRCGHAMEDVGVEDMPPRETGHDVQPTDRRGLRCPACGYEQTLAETVPEGEGESWEDEGPWEG